MELLKVVAEEPHRVARAGILVVGDEQDFSSQAKGLPYTKPLDVM